MDTLPPLWQHQKDGVQRALEHRRSCFAFLFEQGCGKSRTLLEVLRAHFNREARVMHTLILAPPVVCPNWLAEFKKYTNIPEDKICVLDGPGPRRLKQLAKMRMKHDSGFVCITNYEGLVAVRGLFEELLDWSPEVLVLDESQRIKTHNSKRTKAAIKIAGKAKFRYLLSGTPILNSPMDIWAQFRAMDLGASFGDNFWSFRAKYFVDKLAAAPVNFPDWVLRTGAAEEFQRLIADSSLCVKKQDCLDLPPLLKQVVEVDLSPEQRAHYNNMRDEYITFIGTDACTAQLAITKALRLQQIVSGHMPLDTADGAVETFKDTPRQKALAETLELVLEDPAHKVIIWACWRHDYEVIRKICEASKLKLVECHGDVSAGAKSRAVSDFCNDPSVRVFLGHPQSAGLGINLVEASYMIYYSRNFNLENDLQSEARNYRAGSEMHTKVTRIDLVAKNTIDEDIQKALANKQAVGDSLLKRIIKGSK